MTYVFLADGFEEIEALAVVDILRRCKLAVSTVSIMGRRQVTGSHQITVTADCLIEEIDAGNGEAFILPGGLPGADHLEASATLAALLKSAFAADKIVAAICAAPKVLGALGLTKGRRATSYPGYEAALVGASYLTERVVCDGNLITSRGAGTAADFAFALAAALGADPKPVREGMLFDI